MSKINKYALKTDILESIMESQRVDYINSLYGSPDRKGVIQIEYTDKNYKCLPYLDSLSESKIHALSFFSGAGGLDIGAQMAGVKVISSLDFEKDAVETMKKNKFFKHTEHLCDDIRNITAADYSTILKKNNPEKLILVGGPPCQPFSKAGYWKTLENRLGAKDPRNMIGNYLNIIQEIRPNGFILENVESILHPHNIQAVIDLEEQIAKMGYNYTLVKANAADYGVPQKRKRIFIIASRENIKGQPIITNTAKADGSILLPTYERVIDWIGKFDIDKYASKADSTEGKYFEHLLQVPPGGNYISLSAKRGHINPMFEAGKRYWTFLLKLHPLLPSWTIIASPGHWEGPFHWTSRRLRLNELAAIQTFPEDYSFYGNPRSIRKQIGNAVPCLLGKSMIEFMIKNL